MVGIVIVSHSPKIAAGVKDLADEMTQGQVSIQAAGGLDDTIIGTNAERIYEAIEQVDAGQGVLVLVDLGSAVMSTQIAIEMLPEDRQSGVRVSNAPLVEGAVVAAVEASSGKNLEQINQAAEAAGMMSKV